MLLRKDEIHRCFEARTGVGHSRGNSGNVSRDQCDLALRWVMCIIGSIRTFDPGGKHGTFC